MLPKILGYDVCYYCTAISETTILGGHDMEEVINYLKSVKLWDVRGSKYANTLEIRFEIIGGDKEKIKECKNEIERMLLPLSLVNKVGFYISDASEHPRFEGQPGITVGMQEHRLSGIQVDISLFEELYSHKDALEAAEALRLLYSQVTIEGKIAVGWASIEKIFNAAADKNLLTEIEVQQLVEKIKEIHLGEKEQKVIEIVSNAKYKEKTVNERIAENIAKTLGRDYQETLTNIKALFRTRSAYVHDLRISDKSHTHIKYIENLFTSYLNIAK